MDVALIETEIIAGARLLPRGRGRGVTGANGDGVRGWP